MRADPQRHPAPLSHTLRGGDLVARLGGDEFAVISSIAGDNEKMTTLAQRIISAICSPYAISGQNIIIIGASIGIAVIDKNCGTATDIMRYADMALYRAKNEGRKTELHLRRGDGCRSLPQPNCSRRICAKRSKSDQLQLLYQPVVNKRGEIPLSAWRHCAAGNIRPAATSHRPNSSRLPSTAD